MVLDCASTTLLDLLALYLVYALAAAIASTMKVAVM